MADSTPVRCDWAGADPDNRAYHDREWGVPVYATPQLFELLTLEGAQAGLSWLTILRKREGYRRAFAGFDPQIVARFGVADVDRLVDDPAIVRHRGKIESTIGNARAIVALDRGEVGFSRLVWSVVDGKPVVNRWARQAEVPSTSPESHRLSRTLKAHGFRFVGPTTCYAFMQAAGMVNDHLRCCFRHPSNEARQN